METAAEENTELLISKGKDWSADINTMSQQRSPWNFRVTKKTKKKHLDFEHLTQNRLRRHSSTFCLELIVKATPVFQPTAFKLHRSTVFTSKRSVVSNCSACFVADEPISLVDSSLIQMGNKYSWWHKLSDVLTLNSVDQQTHTESMSRKVTSLYF